MAFWGVELKPGKSRTHKFDPARGRLRISQATLGFSGGPEATLKCVVQCNVGNRSPVFLCVLLPGKTESTHLDLEFEEADDVIFSVLGPRSVYLTGYYVRQNHQSFVRSDTESYGVNIENTPSDGYNFNSDDDKYGGSFINDEELQFSPRSPALCIDEGLDEVTPRKARKDRGKLLKKKKPMAIESDSDVNSPKKEDEDGFYLSQQEVLKDLKTHTCDIGVKVALETVEMEHEANDDGVHGSETKQNADPLDISDKTERVTQSPLDVEGVEFNNVKNELPKQVGSSEKIMVSSQEEICGNDTSEAPINQNLPMINVEDQMQSLDLVTQSPLDEEGTKVNDVKNELPKQVGSSEKIMDSAQEEIRGSNTSEAPINQNLPMISGEDQMQQSLDLVTQLPLDEGADVNNELPKQVGSSEKIMVSSQEEIRENNTRDALINQNLPMINGEDQMQQSLDIAKPKNKRKERSLTDKTSKVQTDNEDPSVPRGQNELEIDSSANLTVGEDDMVGPELDLENGQKSKKRRNELLEGELTQGTDGKNQDITEDNLLMQDSLHADGMTEHLPVASGEYEQKSEETRMENFSLEGQIVQKENEVIQEAGNGGNQNDQINRNIGTLSEYQASDNQLGKRIKKKRKKTRGNKDLNTSAIQMSDNQEDEDQSAKPVPKNSRTLSNGLTIEELESGPQGGKVAVPGKMVKICYTGMLKESGHVFDSNAICKYRLGDEEFIDGWNIGINGMHVGDKRRLIIPPSMGFGEDGVGKDIPPNSWVIYDIELLSVRILK